VSLPRFLVSPEALDGATTELSGAELRHLRVRRLRAGSGLILTDGTGRERHGVVVDVDHRHAVIRLTAAAVRPDASGSRLILAQALLKGGKLDFVIEKATELGVADVRLFTCERSVHRVPPERLARWERVALSAAKQCQRSSVPSITGPTEYAVALQVPALLRLMFWEGARTNPLPSLRERQPTASSVLAIVGPEGGFTAAEAHQAADAGVHLVGLGGRILRAETAALVAVTLCQYLWGDLAAASA